MPFEVTSEKALFWRPDVEKERDLRIEAAVNLHRQAGLRGFYCDPKRSWIAQGQSYYAEIGNHDTGQRNVAVGVHRYAIGAALDGYQKVVPNDPVWALSVMEVEVELLRRALAEQRQQERIMQKLENAFDELAAAIACLNIALS